jgi:arabinose-5-phosphate isomerase
MKRDLDILACGSTVVDHIHSTDALLGPESKGFVWQSQSLIGGVALNHLTWAAVLGLKAAVMGPGADDAEGRFLRQGMDGFGIRHDSLLKSSRKTSVSHIYVDRRGERAIYQELGATVELDMAMARSFIGLVGRSRFLSTEVSQLRLKPVLALLKAASRQGTRSFLDLDIAPSQACGTQALGSRAELKAVLSAVTWVKTGVEAARELCGGEGLTEDLASLARALHKSLGKPKGAWVAITGGSRGCGLADGRQALAIPACKGIKAKDSTGAGDAFMGGLIAGTALGLGLKDMGALANACGAACVEKFGACADPGSSRQRVLKLYQGRAFKAPVFAQAPASVQASSFAGGSFAKACVEELAAMRVEEQRQVLLAARDLILAARRAGCSLHLTGIGKSEYVARYMAASLSSTGTPAFFLHGTETLHGSAGQVRKGDVVIAISNSGETLELKAAVGLLKAQGAQVIGVTGRPSSWLGKQSRVALNSGVRREGDALGMAPRASVMAQILVLQALAVELQAAQRLDKAAFKRWHPGGSLGSEQR